MTAENTGLAGYLASAVRAHPDRVAVRERSRAVTYRELDRMTGALRGVLHEAGVSPGDRVVVWLNKSVEAVAGVHGALRAGCAYVPVDPTAPVRRAAHLIERTGPACVLTTPDRAREVVRELGGLAGSPLLVLVGDVPDGLPPSLRAVTWQEVLARGDADADGWPKVGEDDLAYVLYTSGSTGTPKGVMLSHRNARVFVDWVVEEFGLGPDDVLASHAPLHFDLSVLDVFAAAAAGGCVTLVPESLQGIGAALVRFAVQERVSVWYSVPTALRRMATADEVADGRLAASALRVVAFAGEVYHTAGLRDLRQRLPESAALYNLYGPTETNVCTYHRVTAADLAPDAPTTPPIGRPCPYATAVIDGGSATEPGELCVGGGSVMTGYWNDPAGTEERFTDEGGQRFYRTGDLVRRDEAGLLRFVGRRDGMVKLNGYRVELGEVEAIITRHPDVAEAACVVRDHGPAGASITAFVVLRTGADLSAEELRGHCGGYLPRYMVPGAIVQADALAQTSTGKIDRRTLTAMAAELPDGS